MLLEGTRHIRTSPGAGCIACGSLEYSIVFEEFGVDVLRCNRCDHIFSSYRGSQDYDAYFDHEIGDEEEFWWDGAHDRMFRAFGDVFLAGRRGRLLDVGAGLGYFVRFAGSFNHWEAFGYEISPPAVEYAKTKLNIGNMFAGRVEDSGFAPGSFHLITLWDVLEHIPDPVPLLRYLHSLLAPGGTLFIATPNGPAQLLKARLKKHLTGMKTGGHYLEARDHLNLYNTYSLAATLAQTGFPRVSFKHLPPIQAVAGSRSRIGRAAKNFWFRGAQAVGAVTGNRINLNNNLYAVACKPGA